jgi:hypothetical protein
LYVFNSAVCSKRLIFQNPSYSRCVSDIQDPQIEVRCAWCDKENGVVPRSHYSHGICVMHRERMLAEIRLRQKQSVPSLAQNMRGALV